MHTYYICIGIYARPDDSISAGRVRSIFWNPSRSHDKFSAFYNII